MKLFNRILAAAVGIMALSSCVEEAIKPLEGKYPAPVTYELNTLKSQSMEKGEKTRTITVELANEEATLLVKFVSDKYYINSVAHTPVPADQAKNKSYIVGADGSTFTVGGNTVPVESGSITATQDEGTYTFEGSLWLADESIIKFNSTVDLVFEADPEPEKLTTVLSATSNVANGTNSLTINLATDGITATYDPNTWSNVYSGTGNYLALDIYSADGYLHEGTYTANAVGGVLNEGEFGIGYDTTMDFGWGPMEFFNWGTCWWTVNDGATSAEKVLEGTVTVTRKGSKWVIELVSGEGRSMLWTKFEGAIEAVTDPALGDGGNVDDTEYIELTKLQSAQSNVANGVKSLTISMATDGWEVTYDAQYTPTYTGEGNYLSMDIYSEDGKLYTGTYNANTVGGVIAAGEFGIGYDTTMDWGWGPMEMKDWGTCWWTVADGAATAQKVLDGTVEVLVEGANLIIKLKSSLVNAKFTYPVAEFKDGQGNAIEVVNVGTPEVDDTEYVELTKLQSAQSNVANGVKSLTISMATDGFEAKQEGYNTIYTGEGNYLSMDIYSEDGKLYTGTYNANTVGGVLAAGEFGIGYDTTMDWGWGPMEMKDWGTCWWTVADGAATAQKVLDGTVEVLIEGANLVIKLKSTVVNAKFTYPVADFKDGQGNAIEVI